MSYDKQFDSAAKLVFYLILLPFKIIGWLISFFMKQKQDEVFRSYYSILNEIKAIEPELNACHDIQSIEGQWEHFKSLTERFDVVAAQVRHMVTVVEFNKEYNEAIDLIRYIDDVFAQKKLKILCNSESKYDRANVMAVAFELKDTQGDYINVEYVENEQLLYLSSGHGTIDSSRIAARLKDISNYIDMELTRLDTFAKGLVLHNGTFVDPKNIIPEFVSSEDIELTSGEVIYGISNGSNIVGHSIQEMTHILTVGQSGSGKTEFIRWLLYQFLTVNRPYIDCINIIDLKMGAGFNCFKNSEKVSLAIDKEQTLQLLKDLIDTMNSRLKQVIDQGLDAWNGPLNILIIDEYADIKLGFNDSAEASKLLDQLSMKSRAAGIRIIAGLQRADQKTMSQQFKHNLTSQFVFKSRDMGSAELAFGTLHEIEELGWHPKDLNRGRCIADIEGADSLVKIQVPLLNKGLIIKNEC
ncbi:hypothetical protein EAG18_02200 [Pseudoalteromonas sp. J010]|uniref:FtsK/SpoIIIE domain-containing protein n=1 Tax=Pseudoalteromonas sp. J010 TaxID=998465 RepID=UPI000F648EAF|nr:FtsK/SpoIIIE domain-containing protein [Pseudoalteromonas sp. J010]RRS10391.1 hypothetical protein EAG18_02200 [Pseudoalteromonas sp. J010]